MERPILRKLLALIVLLPFILAPTQAVAQSIFSTDWQIDTISLDERWELTDATKKGIFRLSPYQPIYVTAGRWSDNPNEMPRSENPAYSVDTSASLNRYEAKFQISLKTKLWQGVFGDYGDLWAAYTQVAHWQVYNVELSRPFRELNYEPEIFLTFPMNLSWGSTKLRMLGGGFVHQSNGRALPLSRSWNRVRFMAILTYKNWQFNARPWLRIPDDDDENPEISNFIGRAAIDVIYTWKNQQVYAVIHTPFNKINRGSLQLNYVLPVISNLRLQFQFFTGYGETLIDYNHSQTTIGIGVSFLEW